MNQSWSANLLKFMLVAVGVVLMSNRLVYAQTAVEFCSKSEQEQRKIIESLVERAIKQLSSNLNTDGVQKSKETMQYHRRLSNLIRAHFTEEKDNAKTSRREPTGIASIKNLAKYAKEKNPELPVMRILEIYVTNGHEEYYTNANGVWKNGFDSKTDAEQVSQFRDELLKKLVEARIKALREEAAAYEKEAASLGEEIEATREEIKKKKENIKKIDDVLGAGDINAIKKLEVTFHPSKRNSKIGALIFKTKREIPFEFDLQCYINGNKSKTLSISITEKGDVIFVKGKNGSFALGERCEFYYKGEIVRSFVVSEK